ncbi:hypothetical protein GCM10023189_47160 [Nibrella saemangeumensis]|uniref:Uncharacterized protein n=1 Tax=Nibrella saemangeumensis TaxID=1084526 RepID=A0ABP8NE98_9BACT
MKSDEEKDDIYTQKTTQRDVGKHDEFENVANAMGPGDETEDVAQDGRNDRFLGGMDMDSQNGVIRMGDRDNSTMEVTEEGLKSVTGQSEQSKTATVDVTTHGPDDYASAEDTPAPKAQEAAKEQDGRTTEWDAREGGATQEEAEDEISQTGTSTTHRPTY